jgi:hypothetical protein
MATESTRIRKTLSAYALALACVTIIAIGVGLTTIDRNLSTRQIFAMIGLNLIASVVFAVIFSLTSSRVQERMQSESHAEQHDALGLRLLQQDSELSVKLLDQHSIASDRLLQTIAKYNKFYLPITHFADTESYNSEFNRSITHSLDTSTRYYFRGTSAKYIPIRLRNARSLPEQVKIVMLDIKAEKAVSQGAADRQLYLRDRDPDQLAAELIDETLMSLVALYDCRNLCNIEIAFNAASGVTRVELFDDSVYVCVRHRGTDGEKAPFPGYVQFDRESYMWEYQRQELARRMEIAGETVIFHARRRGDELVAILSAIAGRSVSQNEIDAWRASYDNSVAAFTLTLRGL